MHIHKSIVLESKNLRLRFPALEDLPFIFSATRTSGFNDGMLWDPPKSEEELIIPYHNGIKAWEEGKDFAFTIENNLTSDFLGRISIRKTKLDDRWNIGFWTHPDHQGKGIMTEAVQLILKFGFEQLEAKTIESCHALWNKASEKVLIRNGLKFEFYLEKGFMKKGKWVEEHLLSISRDEWLASQSSV